MLTRALPGPLSKPLVFLLVALFGRVAHGSDWPHWRGPQRNDVVTEESGWQDGHWRLEKQWQVNVGVGATSPLVVSNRVYVMGWNEDRDQVECLDAVTGHERWRVSYAAPRYARHATGDQWAFAGPTSTPEYDPATGYLYTLSTDGDLHCWDTTHKGASIWSLNLYDKFRVGRRPKVGRASVRDYGYTTAPLVHGDWVLVEVGSDEGNVVAFDKRTGERRWASENCDPAGHTGGLAPITVAGIPAVAVLTLKNLIVMRLDQGHEGRTLAEYPWVTDYGNNVVSPAVQDNTVLITSGYNQSAIAKLRITKHGAEEIWRKKVYSKVCTPVIANGSIYWSWQTLRCLDFETGRQRWEGGTMGDAGSVIVTRDNRLIVMARQGALYLVEGAERSPERYQASASRPPMFDTETWPHAALSNDRLFCKDRAGNLVCLGILGGQF